MFKKDVMIFRGGNGAAKMRQDVKLMMSFANKYLAGGKSEGCEAEGYFARGIRQHKFLPKCRENTAAYRGVQMLIRKMSKQPYRTELVIPKKDLVPVAPAIKDLSRARIVPVNTGGIVPVDNPNRIVPLDVMREFEKSGKIGSVDRYIYTTVGTGTTEAEAARMAREWVPHFTESCVDGVIMIST